MRVWNGLSVNSRVRYKNKEYIVKELYEKNNLKLCKLFSIEDTETILEGIQANECEKI